MVAPHTGAWIEITKDTDMVTVITVAPHAGAWIEIPMVPNRRQHGKAVETLYERINILL